MDVSVKQAEPMQYPDLELVQISNPKTWTFRMGDEPEILIVIDSGHEGMVHYFWEDAFQTEPRLSGLLTRTKEEVEEKFKIKLN